MRNILRNNQEVAHIWASQSQESGRSGSIFFEGKSIYSYGHHFEIARLVGSVVLFTTRRYSVTTAKHKQHTRRAVSHKTVFNVATMTDHNANVTAYLQDVTHELNQAKRAQYSRWRIGQALRLLNEAVAYVKHFKKDVSPKLAASVKGFKKTNWLTAHALKAMVVKEKKFKAGIEARQVIKRAAEHARYEAIRLRREAEMETLNLWGEEIDTLTAEAFRNGQQLPYDARTYDAPILLRLIEDGKTIETSQGAFVPTEHAKGLWSYMQKGGDIKGVRIGSYEVTGMHDGKLIIGCHKIPLREVARMASKLGLTQEVK